MRLIDADAIIKKLEEMANNEWNISVGSSKGLNDAIDVIDNAPTFEGEILTEEAYSDLCLRASRERPQGKWVQKQVTPASCIYVCSECGTEEVILTNFCCWCGADMRGKEE